MERKFLHTHPYPPFLFDGVKKLIVGTLPPPRFTTGALKEGDVNFCYGSRDGLLWRILDQLFELDLRYDGSEVAVKQRQDFLHERGIGICDIVASARRAKIDASDLGMEQVRLRNLVAYLRAYPEVHTLLFTGGNSKNGPEYFFRRHLRKYGERMERINTGSPRIHEFNLPLEEERAKGRRIKTVSLIAPTGTANRAIGSMLEYKLEKQRDPDFTPLAFRIRQYREFF